MSSLENIDYNIELSEITKNYHLKKISLDYDRLKYLFSILSKNDCNAQFDKSIYTGKKKKPKLIMDLKCYEEEKYYKKLRFEPKDIEREFIIMLMVKYFIEYSYFNFYWSRKKVDNPTIDENYITLVVRSTTYGYELLTNPEKNLRNDIRYGTITIKIKRSEGINFLLDNLESNYGKDEYSSLQLISDNLELVCDIINYNIEYKFLHYKFEDISDKKNED